MSRRWLTAALVRSALSRGAAFACLWMVFIGADRTDLAAGLLVAAIATGTSLYLLPPGRWRLRPVALARLALRFLCQSVVAGADVARRALDPRLPLRPGFVAFPVQMPAGAARNTFTALTSLLPGTVPVGEDRECVVYHCLDVDQPILSQLAAEEAALIRAFQDD